METRWGKRLGRYEIVAELGHGTMGVVYKARDPKIDRFVAVKAISVPNQNTAEEQQYRERFFHEAQVAGRLLHPGIVTIFDAGEEPETKTPYIVMEFVQGPSLSHLCAETKTLRLEQALHLTEELAEALDYAHAQGVVHRDIKPANILITESGRPKIADFGIAKMNVANLTVPGHVIGTPAYMSPEQLQGDPVDGRSDLFSLGVVLYGLLTGYSPFQGNSAATVCFKVANRDPLPVTSFDPSLPQELDAVLSRAMAKDPAQRYQRGIEFALDLRELRERSQMSDPTTSSLIALEKRTGTLSTQAVLHGARTVRQKWHRFSHQMPRNWHVASLALGFGLYLMYVMSKVPSTPLPPASNPPAAVAVVQQEPAPSAASPAPPAPKKAKTHSVTTQRAAKPQAAPTELAELDLQVHHHFAQAMLTVYVDNQLTYSHALLGASKQHLVVLHGVEGTESAVLQVPTGRHSVRVEVQSDADALDESKAITATFAKDDQKVLAVDFEKHNREMRIALK